MGMPFRYCTINKHFQIIYFVVRGPKSRERKLRLGGYPVADPGFK